MPNGAISARFTLDNRHVASALSIDGACSVAHRNGSIALPVATATGKAGKTFVGAIVYSLRLLPFAKFA
jgi:hypothetical protein